MGIFKQDGSRVTKGAVPTTDGDPLDAPKIVSEDLYRTRSYGPTDPKPEGSVKTVLMRAGTVTTLRELNKLFPPARVDKVSPANGAATGGTVVTITGEGLDGTSGVTFGGTAGTALEVVSENELKVTTPAGVAGAVDVVVSDDGGAVTVPGGFTYA